jgi:hypothetical protein
MAKTGGMDSINDKASAWRWPCLIISPSGLLNTRQRHIEIRAGTYGGTAIGLLIECPVAQRRR